MDENDPKYDGVVLLRPIGVHVQQECTEFITQVPREA